MKNASILALTVYTADEVDILNQYLIGKSRLIASYQIDCSDGEVFFA